MPCCALHQWYLTWKSQAGRCRAPHWPNSYKSPSELATHGAITPSFNKCPHYGALLHEGRPTGPCPFTPRALNVTSVERRNAGCQESLKWQLWPIYVWELETDESDEHSALSTESLSSATHIEVISRTKHPNLRVSNWKSGWSVEFWGKSWTANNCGL